MVPLDHRSRLRESGGIGDRRAGRDDGGVVSGDIGDEEGDDRGGGAGRPQASARDGREVLAHAVHLGDRDSGAQQLPVRFLEFGERQAGCGQRQEGRSTPAEKRQHEVVRAEVLGQFQHPFGRPLSHAVGEWVAGLDDLHGPARDPMTVSGHDQTRDRAVPVVLDRLGHGGCGFAGAKHEGAPSGRRG